MASFTDSAPQNFNAFIPTIPVDAFTKVGMFKQQQYEQGLQQVQSYVNGIADLPVDSSFSPYISQRLGDLKKQMNSSISGDFSNQQLVNQIGQAAQVIVRDPIIRNAISSTQAVQKAEQDAENARTQSGGKYWNPANQYALDLQVAGWRKQVQSGNLRTPFGGGYTPYSDPNAHVLPALKEAGVQVTENPFRPDGSINPVMIKQSGLSSERIKSIVDGALTEADKQQLAIDGNYAYRGMDTQGFTGMVRSKYDNLLKGYNDQLSTLQNVTKKLNPNDTAFQNNVDIQINSIKDSIAELNGQRSMLSQINDNNISRFKSQVYTTLYRDDIVKGFSNMSTEFTKNPYEDIKLQEDKLAWDKLKFMINSGNKGEGKNSNGRGSNSSDNKDFVNLAGGGVASNVAMPGDITQQTSDNIKSSTVALDNMKHKIMQAHGLSDSNFNNYLSQYKAGHQIPLFMQSDIDQYESAADNLNRLTFAYNTAHEQAAIKDPYPKLSLRGKDGRIYNYTPEELSSSGPNYTQDELNNSSYSFIKDQSYQYAQSHGSTFLHTYFPFFSSIGDDLYGAYKGLTSIQPLPDRTSSMPAKDRVFMNNIQSPKVQQYLSSVRDISERRNADISLYLSKKMLLPQSESFPINTSSADSRSITKGAVNNVLVSMGEGGKDLSTSEGPHKMDITIINKMQNDDKTNYSYLKTNFDGSGYIILSNSKVSSKDQYIPLSSTVLRSQFPNFVGNSSSSDDIRRTMQMNGENSFTTNINGTPLFGSYLFNGLKNQKGTKYNVTGDVLRDGLGGNYVIQLHINDGDDPAKGTRNVVLDYPNAIFNDTNLSNVYQVIDNITPDQISKLLHKS